MKVEERDNELYVYPDTAGAIFELLVAPGKLYGLVVILLLLAATEGITAFLIILLGLFFTEKKILLLTIYLKKNGRYIICQTF